ncbi:MAG: HAMP domain-containing sensor histidine kinase [Candidatus Omnitrophota bacterium]|jgi:signal transduction histidine kinase
MISSKFARISRYLIIFAAVVLVYALTILDLRISGHPSLVVFYLAPVFLASWFSGARAGFFIAFCSVVSWILLYTPHVAELYHEPSFFYVNMVARSCFMFLMAYLLVRLKKSITHERELVRRIGEQNEELQKLNVQKSTFVANVSHELKNPLAVIKESMALLRDKVVGEVSEEQKEILSMGMRSSDRLMRLVTDLLDLSQIEVGKLKLKKEKIEVRALVEEVLRTYEIQASKKQLVLQKEIQPDLGVLVGDRDKLTEVIINLLNNAIKYTPQGTITVKLTGTAQEVRFEMADTGPGIPPEYQEKIFDKFERIMTEKQEGTGLGLPIAKDIIELHHGKLWVESEPGKGSKFIFALPRS